MRGCDRRPAAPGALLRAGLADPAARAAPRRGRASRVPRRRQRARRVPRPRRDGSDIDIATDARPDAIERVVRGWADAVWLQGQRFGTVGVREGRRALRDHDVPRRRLPPREPQARGHVLRRHRDRPLAPRLHGERDGDRARRARARRSVRRSRRSRGAAAAHAARRPRSRSTTTRCACCARRASSRRSASSPTPTLLAAIEQMRERLQIISAERIRDELSKLMRRRRSVGRAVADRAHGARRRVPARAQRDAARAGSDPPPQGRARAHDRGRRQDVAAAEAPARRAAARRRQAAARAATGRRA